MHLAGNLANVKSTLHTTLQRLTEEIFKLAGHLFLVIQVDTGEGPDAFGASEFAYHRRDILRFNMLPREHLLEHWLVYRADTSAQADFEKPAGRVRE